jgi:N-acetyl-anhydromuramyl-L-alanine amidase AmpD
MTVPTAGLGDVHGTGVPRPSVASRLRVGLDQCRIFFKVRNRLRPPAKGSEEEQVSGATIELVAAGVGAGSLALGALAGKAHTDRKGEAVLDLGKLTEGTYTLRVEAKHTSADDVGPAFLPPAGVDRVFRPFVLTVTVAGGLVSGARAVPGHDKNGTVEVTQQGRLLVGLQPVWMRQTKGGGPRYGRHQEMIVVHRSGDWAPRSFDIWMNGKYGPHYAIDVDGQIVKLATDDLAAWHAPGMWEGRDGINYRSIGIEMINKEPAKYTPAQYDSLLGLIERLRKAFPSILPHSIVGHTDVDLPHVRSEDPGREFDWQILEEKGWGLKPEGPTPAADTLYGGFFALVPGGVLKLGDSDKHRRFGGQVREAQAPATQPAGPAGMGTRGANLVPPNAAAVLAKPANGLAKKVISGNPIAELQADLRAIGYACYATPGEYEARTKYWVERFQKHFNSGRRTGFARDGRLDLDTAKLIKMVKNYVEKIPGRLPPRDIPIPPLRLG